MAAGPLAGFVYSLPHQNKNALLSSRGFDGPYEFTAPVALSVETEAAFKLLTLNTPPPQARPVQQQRPQAVPAPRAGDPPQQQAQAARPPPPVQHPAALPRPAPGPPPRQQQQQHGAPARNASGSGTAEDEEADEDEFYGGLDLDSLVQQRSQPGGSHVAAGPPGSARLAPAPTSRPAMPGHGASTQQQGPGVGAAPGLVCSHGMSYTACVHRQQHLDDVTRQVTDVAIQMADAEGPHLHALQQQVKRLRDIKQLLEAAPAQAGLRPGSGGGGGGGGAPLGGGPGPQQQQQHIYSSGPAYSQQQQQPAAYGGTQRGAPPPPQQQQQQQWGGGGAAQHGGPPAGGGYGAGPAAGLYGGPSGPSYGGAGAAANGAFNGGGGGPSYRGEFGGAPGGGSFDQGPPPAPWEPDRAALQNVRAERKDATNDLKWRQENFGWSPELRERNRDMFGNRNFRLNQLEIMNATLSGLDVFVLMPTGGGKSLCYQLPALMAPGVTIVVSPLVSLIQDQVHHLTVLGIPAACVGGSMDWEQQARVYNSLYEEGGCKVLFITPEKLSASGKLQNTLDALYRRGMLSRVCIDEAHCVSQWGHDFRKDYTKLSFFKQRFPSVPLLALTATATPRVQHDVVSQLGIHKCLMFKSSFNRPNLSYEVRKKKKGCVDEMADLIADKFTRKISPHSKRSWTAQCGIVYCLARSECERVADELEAKLSELIAPMPRGRRRVKHYHASLSPEEREAVQAEWTNGDVPIIVATIAFGMGINKADVRFVFHFSLPKSLEGYLQESGRAGRDGGPSACILYYTYADAAKTRHMIRQSAQENQSPEEQTRSNMESLNAMINYCEEQVECRRVLMLTHFGECSFTRPMCRTTCDNCKACEGQSFVEEDVSEAARKVVEVVRSISGASLSAVVDCFRGNNTAGVRKQGHDRSPFYGVGKPFSKNNGEAERLVRRMVVRGVLEEQTHRSESHLAVVATLAVNEAAARQLFAGQLQVKVHVAQKAGGSNGGGASKARAARAPSAKKSGAGGGAADGGGLDREGGGGHYGQPQQPRQAHAQQAQQQQRQQQQPQTEDPIDLCDEDDDGQGDDVRQRVELSKEALHQLNAALRIHRKTRQGPINTAVQSRIAAKSPRTLEELMSLDLTGMSKVMKQQYGPQIMAALQQAEAYLPGVQQGTCQVADFKLDTTKIFEEEKAQAKRQRNDGWSDDDDDWMEDTRPALEGGERGRPPPQKQPKTVQPPAGRGAQQQPQQAQQQQQPTNFQAFRCNTDTRPQGGGPGSGRQVPDAGPAQPRPQHVGWPQQQQQQQPTQQQQQGGWPAQQQQQQQQQEGWPAQQQQQQRPGPPPQHQQQRQAQTPQQPPEQQQPQQQQAYARPSSAGPFGRPEGVAFKRVPGEQPAPKADDASPEWKARKSGGAARPTQPRPALVQQQLQAPATRQQAGSWQTSAVNVSDAFGGGYSGKR